MPAAIEREAAGEEWRLDGLHMQSVAVTAVAAAAACVLDTDSEHMPVYTLHIRHVCA